MFVLHPFQHEEYMTKALSMGIRNRFRRSAEEGGTVQIMEHPDLYRRIDDRWPDRTVGYKGGPFSCM